VREAVVTRLETGQTTVVVNCFLMSYGVDIPTVECVVLARPTRSVVLYLQCVGRGLRPAPGKDACTVIDHGRVVENLGLPTDDFGWSLEEGSNVNERAASKERASGEETPRTCADCGHLWLVSEQGSRCSCCGWEPRPAPRAVVATPAWLTELAAAEEAAHESQRVSFYSQALAWYARRWPDRWRAKPNSGRWWAWSQTRARFKLAESVQMPAAFWGIWPGTETSVAVSGWLKASMIRFAKSKSRQTA
jgi:hypothetical protein